MNPFIHTSATQRPAVIAECEKRFAANPQIAAEFDRTGSQNRREKVIACLDFIAATKNENATLKANLAAKRQKIAALESAKAINSRLKTSPKPLMSTPSMPTAAAIAAEILKAQAAAEAAAKLKTRAQFSALTPQARSVFLKNGGKLI